MDLVARSQGAERVEIAGATGDMDADYGQGFFSNGLGGRLGIDIIGFGVDIGEDGDATSGDDGAGGGYKGVGRDDDFIAGTDTDRVEGDL